MVRFLQDRLLNFQLLNLKNITLTEGNSPVYRAVNNVKARRLRHHGMEIGMLTEN